MGDMRRRVLRMEIMVDGKNPKEKEEGKSNPGTQLGSFQSRKKNPQTQESREKENQSLGREWKVKIP